MESVGFTFFRSLWMIDRAIINKWAIFGKLFGFLNRRDGLIDLSDNDDRFTR
ncbi:hypothetical protein [Leptolyngbya sp. NIES-2104]|uniref:hypothetical protein n=1 Tax=Leptolyngbya sp. NIES-2104 TaxID=1552121 RepID=UPI0006EC73B9|nr:hypothetical protein [Leptolyngbya sp. NIES-2104]GAP95198.1 hypothetical protein NIES2104_17180 [Leptolyngbya sp. NIES-2104]